MKRSVLPLLFFVVVIAIIGCDEKSDPLTQTPQQKQDTIKYKLFIEIASIPLSIKDSTFTWSDVSGGDTSTVAAKDSSISFYVDKTNKGDSTIHSGWHGDTLIFIHDTTVKSTTGLYWYDSLVTLYMVMDTISKVAKEVTFESKSYSNERGYLASNPYTNKHKHSGFTLTNVPYAEVLTYYELLDFPKKTDSEFRHWSWLKLSWLRTVPATDS